MPWANVQIGRRRWPGPRCPRFSLGKADHWLGEAERAIREGQGTLALDCCARGRTALADAHAAIDFWSAYPHGRRQA